MAKEKIAKTNAARLLDKDKIKYELVPYEVDENDLSCVHVAATLGENIEQVFKTLVLHGDKSGYFVCVIPGEHEIDLKMAAKVSGNKKCDLIHVKELLPLTGYIRGGCSHIGMKKHFPTYIHHTCNDYPYIYFIALFGYYPILKGAFEFKIKNRAVQYILKFAVFNVAAIGSFFVATWLLSIPTDEFTVFGFYVPWAFLIAGNIFFLLYDYAITVFVMQYVRRLRGKIFGNFHK